MDSDEENEFDKASSSNSQEMGEEAKQEFITSYSNLSISSMRISDTNFFKTLKELFDFLDKSNFSETDKTIIKNAYINAPFKKKYKPSYLAVSYYFTKILKSPGYGTPQMAFHYAVENASTFFNGECVITKEISNTKLKKISQTDILIYMKLWEQLKED